MFWNILYFFLKFWAVKICGLQFFWYSKYVGIQSVDDQILLALKIGGNQKIDISVRCYSHKDAALKIFMSLQI